MSDPTCETVNQRRDERYEPPEWAIAIDNTTGYRFGRVIDLSRSGARLLARRPKEPGDFFPFTMKAPEETDKRPVLSVWAICRWCRPAMLGHFDMGVEFSKAISAEALASFTGSVEGDCVHRPE